MIKRHMGASIDDFMKEEGVFEEAESLAINEVAAWQLAKTIAAANENKGRSLRDDNK